MSHCASILNATTYTVFDTLEKAQALAEQNTCHDSEWTYKAEPLPNGKARVAIYDELGAFVGRL